MAEKYENLKNAVLQGLLTYSQAKALISLDKEPVSDDKGGL